MLIWSEYQHVVYIILCCALCAVLCYKITFLNDDCPNDSQSSCSNSSYISPCDAIHMFVLGLVDSLHWSVSCALIVASFTSLINVFTVVAYIAMNVSNYPPAASVVWRATRRRYRRRSHFAYLALCAQQTPSSSSSQSSGPTSDSPFLSFFATRRLIFQFFVVCEHTYT